MVDPRPVKVPNEACKSGEDMKEAGEIKVRVEHQK